MRGLSEGRYWLAALLQHPKATKRTAARAKALALAGDLAIEQEGNHSAARLMYEESLLISKELGYRQGVATSLLGLGTIARVDGDMASARALTEQSLAIWQRLNESWGIAWALHQLGDLAFDRGELEAACLLYNECLEVRRVLGDKSGIAWLFNMLGEVARFEGHFERAQVLYDESLRLHREIGNKGGVTATSSNMGYLALNQGNHQLARAFFEESLSQHLGNKGLNALCLTGLAGVVQDSVSAARLLGAAESFRDLSSSPADRADHERIVAAVRAKLDEATFTVAWEAGRSMLLDQAIEIVLQDKHLERS